MPKSANPLIGIVPIGNVNDDVLHVVGDTLQGVLRLPVDVFDHVGGWWSDASRTEERLPYMCVAAGLSAGSEDICTFTITDVVHADDYHVYVQVDVSFDDQIGEPWGHDYGIVREAIESNNITAYGIISVGGPQVYLPVITKNR